MLARKLTTDPLFGLMEQRLHELRALGHKESNRVKPRETAVGHAHTLTVISSRYIRGLGFLLMLRAWKEGEITREELLSARYRLDEDWSTNDSLTHDGRFTGLLEESENYYRRCLRLQEVMEGKQPLVTVEKKKQRVA